MTTEDRITELEAKMEDLQEQLNMAYDDLDRRIRRERTDSLTICGIYSSRSCGSGSNNACCDSIVEIGG